MFSAGHQFAIIGYYFRYSITDLDNGPATWIVIKNDQYQWLNKSWEDLCQRVWPSLWMSWCFARDRLLAYCLISECEYRGVLQRAECVETIGEWSSARVNKCQLFPSCGGFLLLTANTSKTVRPAPSHTTTGTDWGTQRPGFSYPFTETTVDQMSGGTIKVKSAN